jgi:hypothetical protein
MFFGQYLRVPNVTDIQDYRDYLARVQRQQTPWLTALRDVIDLERRSRSRARRRAISLRRFRSDPNCAAPGACRLFP